MPLIIEDIRKTFGKFPALNGVSLEAQDREFIALLGPSGSGKTTLLRCIAGLETPDSGAVRFQNENLLAQKVRDRRIGLVFQHYALFRHMTAADNIAFGLKAKRSRDRLSSAAIKTRVGELLSLVQLDGLGDRYPGQLSGGQRQRVALARALAIEPRMLLLDEPFGALDAQVRRDLRRWLREIHERTGLTTIFVTHDQEEALELADRVALLKDGQLQQFGTPEDLYHKPASAFVFEFLGDCVKTPCIVTGGAARVGDVDAPIVGGTPKDGPGVAHVRPDAFDVRDPQSPGLRVRLRGVASAGASGRLDCAPEGQAPFEVRVPHAVAQALKPGDVVSLAPREVRVWD